MYTLPKLRAAALRTFGIDPFDMAHLRKVSGSTADNLSGLRRDALRHFGVDPYNQGELERTVRARGGRLPREAAPRQPRAPRTATAPRAPRAPRPASIPKVPKLFSDFLSSGCKNLQLAAKVLGITPRPPLLLRTIREAWIKLIAQHHPDRGGNVESAQAINAAYQLLKRFSN